jgi:hypothetical protein
VLFLKEIWVAINQKIFHSSHQSELENYITSKYPKNCGDVENLTIEFYDKRSRGML